MLIYMDINCLVNHFSSKNRTSLEENLFCSQLNIIGLNLNFARLDDNK